jgi:Rad3-related DNA helicase
VLVGSASFREGFDAPKDKLTWVIIDRLPFAPMDNQMSIRLERLKKWENLTNPFKHSLSLMKLFLVQSVGRLIRTEYDRGLITILDPRMWHEKWDLAGCTPKGKEEWFSKLPIIEEWEQALDQIVETKDYTLLKDTPVIVPEAINI